MDKFNSRIAFILSLFLFGTLLFVHASPRFERKYSPWAPSYFPRMRWPQGMMDIEDFNESLDSIHSDETQENFLNAFEDLSPEIQDSILYFYDENLKLTAENIQLSYIVDYLLKVFPIKVEVYLQEQQQPFPSNPYIYNYYNQYDQYPLMDPGPTNFYNQYPYGISYPSMQSAFPLGSGFGERDKRFFKQPKKFRFLETDNENLLVEEVGISQTEKLQHSMEETILLFLLKQCASYYEATNEMLPFCTVFVNRILESVDKEKLQESSYRINLRRSMIPH